MMRFALADLARLLVACAGGDHPVDLDGSDADEPFTELGYDSLALLDLAGRVQREYGVAIPDDALGQMPTPRAAVAYINARLAGVA
jgi:act minimal PKS acyl carrier protein